MVLIQHYPVVRVNKVHTKDKRRLQISCPMKAMLCDEGGPLQATLTAFYPHIKSYIEGTRPCRVLPSTAPPGGMEREIARYVAEHKEWWPKDQKE